MAHDQDNLHEIAQESLTEAEHAAEAAEQTASGSMQSKASLDLEHTQEAVDKVAFAAAQVRALLEESPLFSASSSAQTNAQVNAVAEESFDRAAQPAVDALAEETQQSAVVVPAEETQHPSAEIPATGVGQPAVVVPVAGVAQPVGEVSATSVAQSVGEVPAASVVQPVREVPAASVAQPAGNLPANTVSQPAVEVPAAQQSVPMQSVAGAQQPVAGQQPATGQQQGYWQGFVPVEHYQAAYTQPTQVPQAAQPIQPMQPAPGQPAVSAQSAQPLYPNQPAQQPIQPVGQMPAQPTQPIQDVRAAQPTPQSVPPAYSAQFAQPTVPVQPAQPTQPTVPVQPAQPGQPTQQIPSAQPTQPAQPAQPAQPLQPVQPAQPGQPLQQPAQQPAQSYTPQLQQPSPYVPADNLTIPQQPDTPGYTKPKKHALALVIALVLGLLAIIAAIIIGRILATSGNSDKGEVLNQLESIEQQFSSDSGSSGDMYSDHNWGNNNRPDGNAPGGGADSGQGSSNSYDDWSADELLDWYNNGPNSNWNSQDGSGAMHIYGGGIEADDGELHDARNTSVAYTISEEEYSKEGTEQNQFYGKEIAYDFGVEYPQLKGDISNLETINATIKEVAMQTVDKFYLNPTQEAKDMLEQYAPQSTSNSSRAQLPYIESDVDYAISYNNDKFISIAFSDEYAAGSWAGGFIDLRTLNINLETGDMYTVDDVLTINEEIAGAFVDNLARYDNGSSIRILGRDEFIQAILGKGDNAGNVKTTFYIDGNGKVNLGVTYALGSSGNTARGWWDYTLTDAQLEAAKKDSALWELIAK